MPDDGGWLLLLLLLLRVSCLAPCLILTSFRNARRATQCDKQSERASLRAGTQPAAEGTAAVELPRAAPLGQPRRRNIAPRNPVRATERGHYKNDEWPCRLWTSFGSHPLKLELYRED
jgi:hypothetical protein